MRNALLILAFLSSGPVLAHPGHGLPGWIHPHLADIALLGLGAFALSMGVYFLGKALKR